MSAEQAQQFRFLGGELGGSVVNHEHLLLGVEGEFANLVHGDFFAFLALYAAQNGFDAEHQFLHAERLGDIVVGSDFKAFEDVFFKRFCSKENDGYIADNGAYFLSQLESVFFRHHHVEHAQVVFALEECFVAAFTVGKEVGVEALCLEIFAQEHAEVFVVLA